MFGIILKGWKLSTKSKWMVGKVEKGFHVMGQYGGREVEGLSTL